MEETKRLNRYQKGILLLMAVMTLVFAVLYYRTITRVGFAYQDTILVPSQEQGSTVYTGRVRGQTAQFTVSADKSVVFQYGDQTYGPYTARKDPSAVPQDVEIAEEMTGAELRQGDEILFRGGVLEFADAYWLYSEDGSYNSMGSFQMSGLSAGDETGMEDAGRVDPAVIFALMEGPQLTHKGDWAIWVGAAFLCGLNVCLILFADELFRWDLAFRIRNADQAEPSEWEMAGRYITWTLIPAAALLLFITGLQ